MNDLLTFIASYLYMLTPAIVVAVFWRMPADRRRVMVLRGIVVLAASVILAKVGGAVYHEPRPFVVEHIAPLIPHPADNGFPSDHTLLTSASAFLILPFSAAWAGIAAVIAASVGLARIGCHLHSVVDILASFVFAGMANALAWVAIRSR